MEPLIAIIASPFLSVPPNALTLVNLFFAMLFFMLMQSHMFVWALLALLGTVFDVIDGYVARITGKQSAFGAFLDSSIDRLSDFFIIASFGYAGLVSWKIIVPAMATSFLVSYVRARAELASGGKKTFGEGMVQRSERLVLIAIALVLFLLLPDFQMQDFSLLALVFLILTIVNIYTIFQRFISSYQKL